MPRCVSLFYNMASRPTGETLEAATLYSYEQGLTPRQVALDEVFR